MALRSAIKISSSTQNLYKLLKSGSPIRTVRHVGDKKLAQAQDELHQFYETPVDITSVHYQTPNVGDVEGSSSKYREFEQSTTYKSLTQPLKIPKLANPFPEPVKVMESHTLSDREKAEIMLAEARQARQFQHHQQRLGAQESRKYSTCAVQEESRREYSTKEDGGKCKKFTKCPKFNLKGCAPQGRKQCRLVPYPFKKCCKVVAPYPSYSEMCHEDLPENPSECMQCPYRMKPIDFDTYRDKGS